jgi:hypothetical protein
MPRLSGVVEELDRIATGILQLVADPHGREPQRRGDAQLALGWLLLAAMVTARFR